jgi:apoptotic chromatin condensation inducer in the nucleus
MVAARGGTERDHRALEINYSEVRTEKFISFERAEKERQEKWAAEKRREEEQRRLKDEQQTHLLLKEHVRNRDPALAAQIERTQHRELEKQMMMRKNMDEQQRAEHERQATQRAHELHQARLREEADRERVERFQREHMERERLRKEKSDRINAEKYHALAMADFECRTGRLFGNSRGDNPFGPPVYFGSDW